MPYRFNMKGDTICTRNWEMTTTGNFVKSIPPLFKNSDEMVKEDAQSLALTWDGITYYFYIQKQ